MSSSSSRPSAHSSPSSLSAPPPLALPHGLNLYITRHGERVDQVFGIDWIEQAFRTYKIAGAEERAERERLEAQAARRKKRQERKLAKLEMRRHTLEHPRPDLRHDDAVDADADGDHGRSSSSSDDEPPQHVSFSFGGNSNSNSGIGAHSDLHHASYVRFNLNMPRDLPSRLPRRDISHFAEDAPLTECGHWQAGLVGEALLGANIQFVYASPALRCVQTAHAICLALGLVPPSPSQHQQQQRRDGAAVAPGVLGTSGASSPAFSSTAPIRAGHARSQTLGGVGVGGASAAGSSGVGGVSYALSAAPPSFSGIRIEYGLFEWTGWYRSYPHWLSARELAHAGLAVDQAYQPVSLRPKQGESLREWYVRSSDTMQRILARHFGTAAAPAAAAATATAAARGGAGTSGSGSSSRRGSGSSVDGLGMPPLCLGSSPPGLGAAGLGMGAPAGGGVATSQPQLYTSGNILFVAHAGSLDTLSYGLLHSNLGAGAGAGSGPVDAATAALRVAPSPEELAMGKRMRLFSNYCGTGRIQYVRHFHGAAGAVAAATAGAMGGSLEPATPAAQSATPAYSSGWSSRRASLALQCDTATMGAGAVSSSSASSSGASSPSIGASVSGAGSAAAAATAGHWQIADDSHYDMTNTSNDPFSFQLSYQSYQKTIAHLLTAVPTPAPAPAAAHLHSPQSLAQIQQQLREAEEDGADAIVLRSASPEDEEDADGETVPHPQSSPRLSPSASAPAAVAAPAPAPVAPSYAPAVLALPAERMLDLSFRKLFGALLDSCNSLANFLLALSAKQTEKLAGRVSREGEQPLSQAPPHRPVVHSPRRSGATGAGGSLSPPGRRSASFGSSSVAALLLQQQSAAGGALGGRLEQLAAAVAGSAVAASSSSSSSSLSTSGDGGPTVLDSWIMAEVHKTAPSMLQVLPREWSLLLNYRGGALAAHVYRLLIALRRFVVPLRRWQRLRKQEKNIVSWTCLLHHIARSDCLEQRDGSAAGAKGGSSCAAYVHAHPASVRCDFICSLSSCIVAVDILARQGFAKKDAAGVLGSSAFGYGSPRSPGSPTAAAFPPPSHSSRELAEWIRRAEKMRRELKEARDGRATGAGNSVSASVSSTVSAAAASAAAALAASAFNSDPDGFSGPSLVPPPPSSRPSTPPPPSLPPARHDGYPHSYDLLELVAGLEPIFGTDSTCSDILKGVLLHSLITGLVDDGSGAEGGDSTRPGGQRAARQSAGSVASADGTGAAETGRARFEDLLLANSRSDATTSLTSSSSLPPGAAAAAAAAAAATGGPDAELLRLAGSDSPAASAAAGADAPTSAAGETNSRGHGRHSVVPAALLAVIPACVSPRAFECIYLLSMAHVSAARLTDPRAAGRALLDLQEKVQDLKEMWAVQAEAKQAAAVAAAANAVAAANSALQDGGGAGVGADGTMAGDASSAVDIAAAHGDLEFESDS